MEMTSTDGLYFFLSGAVQEQCSNVYIFKRKIIMHSIARFEQDTSETKTVLIYRSF